MIRANRPHAEINKRIHAIKSSEERSFRGLLKDGEFDFANDLRYQNFSGLSFAGEDLRGIDFTGANLVDCDFTDAWIDGARFDRARLGMAGNGWSQHVNLSTARDWHQFCDGWAKSDQNNLCDDDHLPPGALFRDSPQLPMMIRLPMGPPLPGEPAKAPIAISCRHVDGTDASFLQELLGGKMRVTGDPAELYRSERFTREEVINYANWASKLAGRNYRIVSRHEYFRFCGIPPGKANDVWDESINEYGLKGGRATDVGDWLVDRGECRLIARTFPSGREDDDIQALSAGRLRIVRELRSSRANFAM